MVKVIDGYRCGLRFRFRFEIIRSSLEVKVRDVVLG